MILASALVAFSLFDFFPTLSQPTVPAPERILSLTGAGELTATFAPVSVGSVARGATRVPVAVLNLSASCDADITVESLRLMHTGRGATSDISAVWIGDSYRRLTRSTRFDAGSNQAVLRFRHFTVPRCDAKRLTIFIDLARDAAVAGEHSVMIQGVEDLQSSAQEVSLSWSDDSEQVVITPYDAARLTVNFLPVRGPLSYGRRMTVARLQITGDADRPLLLQRIVLTNLEDARDMDLRNFALQTRVGEVLSGPTLRMDGREVRIDVVPTFRIERSQTVVLDVVADIHSSRYRKVRFVVLEPSDVSVAPARTR